MISVVCPMRNEQESLSAFFGRLTPVLEFVAGDDYEVVCINDGSTDTTLMVLLAARQQNNRIRVIDLSRNFGKEAALTCGIDHARGSIVVPIDADLQHPPELIVDMVRLWRDGYDVVLARREDRKEEHWLRRKTAAWFYGLHNKISEIDIPADVGDFRLMDRKVVDALKKLPERQRFMKGLFSWAGFRQTTIPYTCEQRIFGKSKFSSWKLWNFALEGITSFSTAPLRIWTYLGLGISLIAFIYASWLVGRALLFGPDVPGYASLIVSILFLGGLQLVGLGIMGEYIGRIYSEVKQRPIYLIRDVYDAPDRP